MEVGDAHGVSRLLVALALHGEGGGLRQVAAALAPRHLDDAAQQCVQTLRVGGGMRQQRAQRQQQHVHQRARLRRRLIADHHDAVRCDRFARVVGAGTLTCLVVAKEGEDAVKEEGAVREFLQRRATQRHVLQEAAETLRAERLQTRLSVRGERRNHCRVQRLPRREDEVERATHVLDQVFLLLAVGARAQTVASQEERRQSDAPLGGAERAHDGRQLLRGKRQGRCAVVRAGETRVERSGGV